MNKSNIYLDFQCQKKWHLMESQEGGRFCNSCKKTVIDFSETPIDKLNQSSFLETEQRECGSYFAYQLDRPFNNWKDLIISFYQKSTLSNTNNKLLRPITLFLVMILLIATGCHRRRTGYRGKPKDNTNKNHIQVTVRNSAQS